MTRNPSARADCAGQQQGDDHGRGRRAAGHGRRARLSYRRAATLLEEHTAGMRRGPFTLHQLRRSRLTHAAEKGASTPMLMALSGHTSVRSLVKYAKVSAAALGRWQAETDPAARRRSR
ncbi:tyrosine-type recombinase/integrase [Nocardia rhamnosiphila]|uniref:tyrosine-type recombinase/integrase n=1 Tax=Nocardia rhamnosiphila TaxID=426716 RepID=UPI00224848C9